MVPKAVFGNIQDLNVVNPHKSDETPNRPPKFLKAGFDPFSVTLEGFSSIAVTAVEETDKNKISRDLKKVLQTQ